MLRSLFLTGLYFGFLAAGFAAPFAITLGYVWVDAFRPQEVAYIILNQFPVAMIMGAAAIGSYFLMDRRAPPRINALSMMHATMVIWVTLTMVWAVGGTSAWIKWDWATKTLLFSAFLPLVIRSKVQIEAFVQTYLLALAANFVPFGFKTLISGGGYGQNLGLVGGNSGLAEGGLLSTACLMMVPLALHFARHNTLLPQWKLTPLGYWGLAGLALATATGTFQRSAIIGLGAMGFVLILFSKHKLLYFSVAGVLTSILAYATSDKWLDRIASITEYTSDGSAMVRILVWRWTLEFVKSYPLGGGFNSYVVNQISIPGNALNPAGETQFGRAFHSVYFEVLGEQGWPGLFLFLAIAIMALFQTWMISRRARKHPELEWCSSLAVAIMAGFAVFLTAGAFVGIAFQPMFWYFVAMTVCLRSYVQRVMELDTARADTGWRSTAQRNLAMAATPVRPGGWRPPVAATTARRGSRPAR